jgi:hypothetical protein
MKVRSFITSLAVMLLALITIQPAHASISQIEIRRQQAELSQRIEKVREKLIIENQSNPDKIAQWYNWPNWPNWSNWNNWRNF